MMQDEIERRFAQREAMPANRAMLLTDIQDVYLHMAIVVGETLPESREASLAITALEESLMWAQRAIEG